MTKATRMRLAAHYLQLKKDVDEGVPKAKAKLEKNKDLAKYVPEYIEEHGRIDHQKPEEKKPGEHKKPGDK